MPCNGRSRSAASRYLRFVLDDRHLTEVCKTIRHELTATLAVFPAGDRHAARDTQADVGAELTLDSQRSHASLAATVAANFKHIEQAFRGIRQADGRRRRGGAGPASLPRLHPGAGDRRHANQHQRLAAARLYVLVDGCQSAEDFGELVEASWWAGVSIIRLRDKQTGRPAGWWNRARRLRAATAGTSGRCSS